MRLFYAEGIHTVGVDRIVAEAGVTKATFYRYFPAKDDLVRVYLEEVHRGDLAAVEAAVTADSDPRGAILALFELNGDRARDSGYRGCPYINAAAEYPDPRHPVRDVITVHRTWLLERFTGLLTVAGNPRPADAARMLVLLWDGAGVGGYFDDPDTVLTALRDAAHTLITSTPRNRLA